MTTMMGETGDIIEESTAMIQKILEQVIAPFYSTSDRIVSRLGSNSEKRCHVE